jgi:nicotinamide phosphoribosyltransferase
MLESILESNFILSCDSYKLGHYRQLSTDIGYIYSTTVPRKPSKYSDKITAVGQTLVSTIFAKVRVDEDMINEAEIEAIAAGYEFNRAGWEIIARELCGKLPLAIYGVPEGTVVEPQTPIVGVINTDPRFAWLPSYVETIVQDIIWKMSTVATVCRSSRLTIQEYIDKTGANPDNLAYALHNFGDRAADSPTEAAVMAGMAHAIYFSGSDCIRTNRYIRKMYNTSKTYVTSVEATEHSVMVANSNSATKDDFGAAGMAVDLLKYVVDRSKRGIGIPVCSAVIDTYDSRRFVQDYIGTRLKEDVINSGGKLVLRPDTGDITIEPGMVGIDIENTFGVTINENGYKVLPDYIGVLQGDGIKVNTIRSVLDGWTRAGFSMDNFVLGMGSGISHDAARDDFSFSTKAVAKYEYGRWERMLKEPITDIGKKSLSGLVYVGSDGDVADAINSQYGMRHPAPFFENDNWRLWFHNGHRVYRQTFDEVRELARK